ncbi:HNH endonuclease [Amycolatopsis sp. cmx-4-54]|uniref:HNH endonuclease n=1 Tax=Amycolatopsis sp. cmx-4-54 TaxID=2790936 RepID=UPI0039788F58
MSAWSGSDRAARLPRTWPTIRRRVLRRDPTCRVCWSAPSTEVDHIVPGDDHRENNLQGICSPCHASKSGQEGGRAAAARRPSARRPPEPHPGLIER